MLTVAFTAWFALVALSVRWFRIRARFSAARWCLWSGFFLGYAAFWAGAAPRNLISFTAIFGCLVYVIIQDMRIQAAAKVAKSE